MGKTTEDIYTLTKRFFEQDYHDRGMIKWQGYYLSDDTEDVAQYTMNQVQKAAQTLLEAQTVEEIGHILKAAYDAQLDASIQLSSRDRSGLTSDIITGKILGYTEQNAILINQLEVDINQINAVKIKS